MVLLTLAYIHICNAKISIAYFKNSNAKISDIANFSTSNKLICTNFLAVCKWVLPTKNT